MIIKKRYIYAFHFNIINKFVSFDTPITFFFNLILFIRFLMIKIMVS